LVGFGKGGTAGVQGITGYIHSLKAVSGVVWDREWRTMQSTGR
jgi:hypothetical protein